MTAEGKFWFDSIEGAGRGSGFTARRGVLFSQQRGSYGFTEIWFYSRVGVLVFTEDGEFWFDKIGGAGRSSGFTVEEEFCCREGLLVLQQRGILVLQQRGSSGFTAEGVP